MTDNYLKLSARECAERLLLLDNPIVFIHPRPDGDAVGSAAALCEIFSQLGIESKIACADPIPERLSFILEYCATLFTQDTAGKTPIAIDVASPMQLGTLSEKSEKPILMIDHHAVGAQFADGLILPDYSSAGEVLFEVACELIALKKITLTKKLAYALYTAISSDTGRFAYSNASPKTYRTAALLIETGIDAADINHRLFSSKTPEQIKAEGFIASNIKTDLGGKVAYAAISSEERNSLSLSNEHFESAIDIVRSVAGVKIAVFIREIENGSFKASLRSTEYDVASVAAKFGGGGHILAAGCTIKAENINLACEMVLKEIKNTNI